MDDIYPPFKDDVAYYAVGFNESLSDLVDYQGSSGHIGTPAVPVGNLLRDFEVASHSTKLGIDHNGVIVYRSGYGQGSADEYRDALQRLADAAPEQASSAPMAPSPEDQLQPSAAPQWLPADTSAAVELPSEQAPDDGVVQVGHRVGERAPAFGMSLASGEALSSEQIVGEGRPAFLYFHATY